MYITGASINFSAIDTSIIPRSLLVILVGACVRVPVAILVTWGNDLSWLERAYVGLSWIPKATVQVNWILRKTFRVLLPNCIDCAV